MWGIFGLCMAPISRWRGLILGLLTLALVGVPPHAYAQAPASARPRVVFIAAGDEAFFQPLKGRFLQGMRDLGHVDGTTFQLEIRYAQGEPARSATLIQEAVASRPAVLVFSGLTNARRAREATTTVPVVVATGSDLVDAGIVASFARPGGNITGITDLADEVAAKRLELLSELSPRPMRVALLDESRLSGHRKGRAQSSRGGRPARRPHAGPPTSYATSPNNFHVAVAWPHKSSQEFTPAGWELASPLNTLETPPKASIRHPPKPPAHYMAGDGGGDGRRSDPWRRLSKELRTLGLLRRSHPEGGEAGRPPRRAADALRAGAESQGRDRARHHISAGDDSAR